MLRLLYQLALGAALLLASPVLLLRRGSHVVATAVTRLGRYRRSADHRCLWVHAVSVGEVGAAIPLLEALPEERSAVLTTITPTGQRQARKTVPSGVETTYHPLDFGFAIRRFFRAYHPAALILVEGDLWPLSLRSTRDRRAPIVVVNGRISDRNYARLRRIRRLARLLFEPVDHFAVQSDEDRRRLVDLGVAAERVQVTGNLKFDVKAPAPRGELESVVRRLAGDRAIWLAGSTMQGEEPMLLEALSRLDAARRPLLVLAPRHPERWADCAATIEKRFGAVTRRSQIEVGSVAPALPDGPPPVLLLDSLGELAALYRVCDIAFVGGTLVPTGGHNPIEPARFGRPVLAGPSMHNFRDIARLFDSHGAWRRVASVDELTQALEAWLHRPEEALATGRNAERLVAGQRGATERTLRLLAGWVPEFFGTGSPDNAETDTTAAAPLSPATIP